MRGRRSSGNGIVGTLFLWVAAVFMIIAAAAGIKFIIDNDFGSSSEISSDIIPVTSEDNGISEDVTTSDNVSSEDALSSDEVTSSQPSINPFDNLSEISSIGYIKSDFYESIISPLSGAAYRSSVDYGLVTLLDDESQAITFSFNSLRMIKDNDTETYKLRLGFPGTVSQIHYDSFGLGLTYSSWLIAEHKMLNNTGIDYQNDTNAIVIYRSNVELQWDYLRQGDELLIEADNNYYQFGVVFNTNSKTSNFEFNVFELPY